MKKFLESIKGPWAVAKWVLLAVFAVIVTACVCRCAADTDAWLYAVAAANLAYYAVRIVRGLMAESSARKAEDD